MKGLRVRLIFCAATMRKNYMRSLQGGKIENRRVFSNNEAAGRKSSFSALPYKNSNTIIKQKSANQPLKQTHLNFAGIEEHAGVVLPQRHFDHVAPQVDADEVLAHFVGLVSDHGDVVFPAELAPLVVP